MLLNILIFTNICSVYIIVYIILWIIKVTVWFCILLILRIVWNKRAPISCLLLQMKQRPFYKGFFRDVERNVVKSYNFIEPAICMQEIAQYCLLVFWECSLLFAYVYHLHTQHTNSCTNKEKRNLKCYLCKKM